MIYFVNLVFFFLSVFQTSFFISFSTFFFRKWRKIYIADFYMSLRPRMKRQINIPPFLSYLPQRLINTMISVNDEILISHCFDKKPKYGMVMSYGIEWKSFEEFRKDAEEVCHEFWQLYVSYPLNRVVALSHADEVYNQKINPLLS